MLAPTSRRDRLEDLWLRAGLVLEQVPGWALALSAYAVARLVSGLVIAEAARFQPGNLWTGDGPTSYIDMTVLWDSSWYRIIAEHGYPAQLPYGPAGDLQQNPWAFYPAYPYTVKAVMAVTGWGFPFAGGTTSLLLGAAAIVALYQLVRRLAGRRVALGTAVLVSTFPAAPVLQIGYSEALGLLLVVLVLSALVARRYLLAVPIVVVLALARPVVAPMAAVVLVHVLVRWARRRTDPFPPRQVAASVLLGLVTAASAGLWPWIVGWRTGRADAYQATMASWRTGGHIELLTPTWHIAKYLLGDVRGVIGLVLLAVLVVGAMVGPWARPLGPELRAWGVVYPAYLAVVLEPWTSTFRYMLLGFPFAALLMLLSRSKAYLVALVVASTAGMVVWVVWLLRFIPPTDYPP